MKQRPSTGRVMDPAKMWREGFAFLKKGYYESLEGKPGAASGISEVAAGHKEKRALTNRGLHRFPKAPYDFLLGH